MNPGDKFENIVAATIKEFNVFSGPNAKIFQKKVYPGAKDPNGYQIDISIELMLTPELFFLIIVECKDHARPVERSVVQQLIQVRDDISAHKAIIVSTKGFNSGAVRLAESNRIALWQWARPRFCIVKKMVSLENLQNRMRRDALIKGSLSYFCKRGIMYEEDSLVSELKREYIFLIEEQNENHLVLTKASLSNFTTSENGYISVDMNSNPRKTFFLDVVNAILESETSESHKLQSHIDSQYEEICRKHPHLGTPKLLEDDNHKI